jgi:hypothetical protein
MTDMYAVSHAATAGAVVVENEEVGIEPTSSA